MTDPPPSDVSDADARLLRALRSSDGVDPDAGLANIGGNASTYRRLLDLFVRTHAGDGERIAALVAGGDPAAARSHAHRLRGSAATLGLLGVDVAAEAVERADDGAAEVLHRLLDELLPRLRAALDA